jgi:hypothetical protein
MGFGDGAAFSIIIALVAIYGIPLAIVVWVLRSILQMRTKLDQIQSRLDDLSAQLNARR